MLKHGLETHIIIFRYSALVKMLTGCSKTFSLDYVSFIFIVIVLCCVLNKNMAFLLIRGNNIVDSGW